MRQVIDRVLATVDGHLVTLSDVRATTTLGLTPAPDGAVRETRRWTGGSSACWCCRKWIASRRRSRPPPSSTRVAAVLAPLGAPDAVRATLARLGIDQPWVARWVRDDLRIQAYTEQRFAGSLEPTGDELENYYREHAAEFVRDGRELTAEEARAIARDHVMAARRRALLADWLDGLRRRATIVRTGRPVIRAPDTDRGRPTRSGPRPSATHIAR